MLSRLQLRSGNYRQSPGQNVLQMEYIRQVTRKGDEDTIYDSIDEGNGCAVNLTEFKRCCGVVCCMA